MNINVCLVSEHHSSLGFPTTFAANAFPSGSPVSVLIAKLMRSATFHCSASITVFLALSKSFKPHTENFCCDFHPSHLELYFKIPHRLSSFLNRFFLSWFSYLMRNGRRGCRPFAAVCNKVGARGSGCGFGGWGFRADDSLPRLYRQMLNKVGRAMEKSGVDGVVV
jgi:hypothetical protein